MCRGLWLTFYILPILAQPCKTDQNNLSYFISYTRAQVYSEYNSAAIKQCLADRFTASLNFIHHLLQSCIFGEIISVISLHVKRGFDLLLFYTKVHLNRSSLRDNHKRFPIIMLNNSSVLWDLFKVSLREEIFPGKSSRGPYHGRGLRSGDLKGYSFSILACFGISTMSLNIAQSCLNI